LKQEASIFELFCDPELVFFSDETWLTVNSDVNSNREIYWCLEYLYAVRDVPFHGLNLEFVV